MESGSSPGAEVGGGEAAAGGTGRASALRGNCISRDASSLLASLLSCWKLRELVGDSGRRLWVRELELGRRLGGPGPTAPAVGLADAR